MSSLFLACSTQTPRNETVRLDTERTLRSTGVSATYNRHNVNQVCDEILHLQVDGDVIPITQLQSGSQFSGGLGCCNGMLCKHLAFVAVHRGTCSPLSHFPNIDVVTATSTATCCLVHQRCDQVAALLHIHVLRVGCGCNFLNSHFCASVLGSHSSVKGHVAKQSSLLTPTSAVCCKHG